MIREDNIESRIFSIKSCTYYCVRDKEDEKDHMVVLFWKAEVEVEA